MESDDESFYITQDSFRKDVDVDESDDPNFLEWVNDDFYEAQDQKKDNNGIQAKACSSTRKITPVSDEDLKRRLIRDMTLVILVRI